MLTNGSHDNEGRKSGVLHAGAPWTRSAARLARLRGRTEASTLEPKGRCIDDASIMRRSTVAVRIGLAFNKNIC